MSLILKYPTKISKGVISFTSLEEKYLRKISIDKIKTLKKKWIILMHPNYFIDNYNDDYLFDGYLALEETFKIQYGNSKKILNAGCMNFSPNYFENESIRSTYDIMAVTRMQKEKNVLGFFRIIKKIFKKKSDLSVLLIVTVPGLRPFKVKSLRKKFDELFSVEEKRKFELITLDYDGDMPLNRKTLSIFYKSSRIYLSTHLKETGGRVVAYARAAGMPVVSFPIVAYSAKKLHRMPPYFYIGKNEDELSSQALKALDEYETIKYKELLKDTSKEFLMHKSFTNIKLKLIEKFNLDNDNWRNLDEIDIKIAKHNHGWESSNTYLFTVSDIVNKLLNEDDISNFDEDNYNIEINNKSFFIEKTLRYLKYSLFIASLKLKSKINNILEFMNIKSPLKKLFMRLK